ncbi:hypothetical protein [Cryobacterium sp. Y57]|uniref:hypothetical protein n=1 Tax=Cryobacterium sp. Y57 TaxID=2048287 RepID=UPI000CE4236F|nr:hypothetical protein [Cryobacterium sp. Y57]
MRSTQLSPLTSPISTSDRDLIAEIAQVLIPAGASGPSAAEVDVAGGRLDEFFEQRPDLKTAFVAIASRASGTDVDSFCRHLEASEPAVFQQLTYVIVGAFLLSPDARGWLGFTGLRGEFQTPIANDDYRLHELLAPVRSRPPSYRPTAWTPEESTA